MLKTTSDASMTQTRLSSTLEEKIKGNSFFSPSPFASLIFDTSTNGIMIVWACTTVILSVLFGLWAHVPLPQLLTAFCVETVVTVISAVVWLTYFPRLLQQPKQLNETKNARQQLLLGEQKTLFGGLEQKINHQVPSSSMPVDSRIIKLSPVATTISADRDSPRSSPSSTLDSFAAHFRASPTLSNFSSCNHIFRGTNSPPTLFSATNKKQSQTDAMKVLTSRRDTNVFHEFKQYLQQQRMNNEDNIYDEELFVDIMAFSVQVGQCSYCIETLKCIRDKKIDCPFSFYQTIMKLLCSKDATVEALQVYDEMEQVKVLPDASMLRCLVNICYETDRHDRVVAFFEDLKKLEEPSMKCYTTLIRSYAKNKDCWSALRIMKDMLQRGVATDSLVLNSVLTTLVEANEIKVAKELLNESLSEVGADGKKLVDIVSFNILCKGYNKTLRFEEARATTRIALESGCRPNEITFNTVIDAAVRCGRYSEAWSLVKEMQDVGLPPDKYTCSILVRGVHSKNLSINTREANIRIAMDHMQQLALQGQCALLELLSFCIVESCAHTKNFSYPLSVLCNLQRNGVQIPAPTCGSVIKVLALNKRIDDCLVLWDGFILSGAEPTAILYGVMMDACVKNNVIDKAIEVFNDARNRGAVNTVMYATLLKGLARGKNVNEAMIYYSEMMQESHISPNVVPDLITFSSIIQVHCEAGNMSGALQIVDDMKRCGVALDCVVYNTLINGCFKQVNLVEAEKLYNEMILQGVQPSSVTHSIMVKIYGRSKNLEWAFDFVRRIEEKSTCSVLVYTSLLQACIRNNQLKRAVALFDELETRHIEADAFSFSTIINGCAQSRQFDATLGLVERAAAKNIWLSGAILQSLWAEITRRGDENKYSAEFKRVAALHKEHGGELAPLPQQRKPSRTYFNKQYPNLPAGRSFNSTTWGPSTRSTNPPSLYSRCVATECRKSPTYIN